MSRDRPTDAVIARTPAPVRTALDLRAAGLAFMRGLGAFSAGTPVTGPMHRTVWLPVSADRSVKVDIIEPLAPAPRPVMVYVHGGGWVMGDLDLYHQLVRRFAEQGFVVVAVDYSLAPEAPFPAGHDDCVAAIRWAIANIARYGGDPAQLVLAGDSAGANIAAGIAVSWPDLPIRAVALLYGIYDFENMRTPQQSRDAGFLGDLHQAYLGGDGLHLLRDPRVSPIHAAAGLPPAFIAVGSSDIGVNESVQLAEELRKAGVEHRLVVLKAYPHAFMQIETLPETLPMFRTIASYLVAQMAS